MALSLLSRSTAGFALGALLVLLPPGALRADTTTAVPLNYNENAFGASPRALAAAREALADASYYNGGEAVALAALIAKREALNPAHVLLTPGSGPILELVAAAHAGPGREVINLSPGYTQLDLAFARLGGRAVTLPADPAHGHGYDFAALRALLGPETAVVFVCNPNNPTGALADPDELRAFIRAVPEHILVVVDEAYLEVADGGLAQNTMAGLIPERAQLLVVRTFSKLHGLAGLRAGYGLARPETLAPLLRHSQGGPSYLAALAARESLLDEEHLAEVVARHREARATVQAGLAARDIPYAPSQATFVLFDSGLPHGEMRRRMAAAGVLINHPHGLAPDSPYSTWARVSLGRPEQLAAFFEALDAVRRVGAP
jgi:histidinol-phosphate aminotransferase